LLAVHAHRQQGQRVHRLVQPQPFYIRPLDQGEVRAHAGHDLGVLQGLESDVFSLGGGLHLLEQVGQGEPQPGNDHGPGLHAAHAVDALLQLVRLDEVFQGVAPRLAHLAIDDHRPRFGLHGTGIGRRVALVGTELVVVVVAAGVLERRDGLPRHGHGLPLGGGELVLEPGRCATGIGAGVTRGLASSGQARQARSRQCSHGTAQQGATGEVDRGRRDLGLLAVRGFGELDQHGDSVTWSLATGYGVCRDQAGLCRLLRNRY